MPYLTPDNLPPAPLAGRLPIGRRLPAGLSLPDPAVSRLHAWVEPVEADEDANEPAGWAVCDAGSQGGTFVNGRAVRRRVLRDGDAVRVGNTTLTYRAGRPPTPGVPPPALARGEGGVLFACDGCDAPLWVGDELAGKRGVCRHCRKLVTVPALVTVREPTPPPVASAGPRRPPCGVCHGPIAAGEPRTVCPECGIAYHAECWAENHGCSTYGCGQVDAVGPTATEATQTAELPTEPGTFGEAAPATPPVPWDGLLVAAAAIAAVIGLPAFGCPAAVVALVGVIRLTAGRSARPGLLGAALFVALIGVAVGLAASDVWYLGARHLPAALRL